MAAVELCAASAANIVIHVQSIHEKVVLDTSGGGLQQFWLQPRVQLAVSSPPGLPSVPPSPQCDPSCPAAYHTAWHQETFC